VAATAAIIAIRYVTDFVAMITALSACYTFNNLHFDTGLGPLTINKVLSVSSSLIPYVELRNLPKPSVESQILLLSIQS
jgi:hypothetical protein